MEEGTFWAPDDMDVFQIIEVKDSSTGSHIVLPVPVDQIELGLSSFDSSALLLHLRIPSALRMIKSMLSPGSTRMPLNYLICILL
jgi:hypothetical protein